MLAEGVICLGLDASLGTVFSFVFMIPLHDRRRFGWMTVMVLDRMDFCCSIPRPVHLRVGKAKLYVAPLCTEGQPFLEMY
jgi:hypothetical protein